MLVGLPLGSPAMSTPPPPCPWEGPHHAHLGPGAFTLVFYWLFRGSLDPSSCSPLLSPAAPSWLPLWGPRWERPAGHRLLPSPGQQLGLQARAASLRQTRVSHGLPFGARFPRQGCVPALGTAKLSRGLGSSPDPGQCLPGSGPFRPRTAQRSTATSGLKLGVEVEEVGCRVGCGRRHVPCGRGRTKSVAEGAVEGRWGEVHQTRGHG